MHQAATKWMLPGATLLTRCVATWRRPPPASVVGSWQPVNQHPCTRYDHIDWNHMDMIQSQEEPKSPPAVKTGASLDGSLVQRPSLVGDQVGPAREHSLGWRARRRDGEIVSCHARKAGIHRGVLLPPLEHVHLVLMLRWCCVDAALGTAIEALFISKPWASRHAAGSKRCGLRHADSTDGCLSAWHLAGGFPCELRHETCLTCLRCACALECWLLVRCVLQSLHPLRHAGSTGGCFSTRRFCRWHGSLSGKKASSGALA